MANPISPRDLQLISEYLDGALSPKERSRLQARLRTTPELQEAYEGLLRTRHVLHSLPVRRVPRNFTLTPAMVGRQAAALPQAFPVLRFASVLAVILLVVVLAGDLVASSPLLRPREGVADLAYSAQEAEVEMAVEEANPQAAPAEPLIESAAPLSAAAEPAAVTATPEMVEGASAKLLPAETPSAPAGMGEGEGPPSTEGPPSAEEPTAAPLAKEAPPAGDATVLREMAPAVEEPLVEAAPSMESGPAGEENSEMMGAFSAEEAGPQAQDRVFGIPRPIVRGLEIALGSIALLTGLIAAWVYLRKSRGVG